MTCDLKLYGMDVTPLVRSCKLVLKLLDVPYEYKIVDLFCGEQRSAEFAKRNPIKLVPVLEDNGELLVDSSAICCYLVDKYGKDDKLYPKDLIQRARVNHCLFFNSSVIYPSVRNMAFPIFRKQTTIVSKEKLNDITHGYELLEALLEGHDFMAGNHWTIPDLITASLLLISQAFVEIDKQKFPRINAWLERVSQEVPYFKETHTTSNNQYIERLKSMITEIQY